MGSHMLKYHVEVPLGVFAVLFVNGVPLASAARYGVAAGCVAMVLMMLHGGSHHDARSGEEAAARAKETNRAA